MGAAEKRSQLFDAILVNCSWHRDFSLSVIAGDWMARSLITGIEAPRTWVEDVRVRCREHVMGQAILFIVAQATCWHAEAVNEARIFRLEFYVVSPGLQKTLVLVLWLSPVF